MTRPVRLLSAPRLGMASWLGAALACAPEAGIEPKEIDYVRVSPAQASEHASVHQSLHAAGDPLYLFLNFCQGGCRFAPGSDDARRGTSSIVRAPVELSESVMGDEEHDELLRCLYEIFEPFEITIARERPEGHRYVEAVVAGRPQDLGLSQTIAGVSPLACGLIEYGVNFNFFNAISRLEGVGELCNVIAHETGHTIGLDHAYLCSDVMTYLPHCETPADFTRTDAQCGGFFVEPCSCGGEHQNSYLTVLKELGPRQSPIELPPRLRIQSPVPLAAVQQGFFVVLDVRDQVGVREVEVFLDDVSQGKQVAPPFVFPTPLDWPEGPVTVRAIAINERGQTSTATRDLEVLERRPDWDAGFLDATGPRPDAGMSWNYADASVAPDAAEPRPLAESGCTCVVSSTRSLASGLALAAFGLLLSGWPRRRRGAIAACLTVALLAGCEEDVFLGVQPKLASDPEIGTPIDFGELIFGERLPRALDIQFRNEGQGSLLFDETILGPNQVGPVIVSGPLRTRLEPGGVTELLIEFKPERPGRLETELVLVTNDPEQPRATYPVLAEVRERCRLLPWPTALDFRLGDERTVSLLSASTSPCRVTQLSMDEELFELVDPPELPLVLEPGAEIELVVRHHTRSRQPHVPYRTLRAYEAETDGAEVKLIGAYPIWKCLAAYPDEYEFPRTPAGTTSELLLTVTNRCNEAADIETLGMPYGAEAFVPVAGNFPISVPARSHASMKVEFRPPDGLDYYGRVRIGTNDAGNRALYLGMLGRAHGPVFGGPNHLDLGAVPHPSLSSVPCVTPARVLPIFNLGEGGLLVHRMELIGPDAEAFRVVGLRIGGIAVTDFENGFVVPPFDRAELLLEFTPTRSLPAEHEAELVVHHTPESSSHTVELVGRASGEAESVEYFTVARPEVDVLLVVDGSRSMRPHHETLVAAAADLVSRSDLGGETHQIALIGGRQERPEGGRLLGCRFRDAVLQSGAGSTAERTDDLVCALRMNTLDERPQAGLAAASLALGRAAFPSEWDPTTHDNERWLRPSAHLAMIFVSDEEDVSRPAVETFHKLYAASKGGRADLARVHAIVVPQNAPCLGERYAVPGVRYARAAELASGTVESICDGNLEAGLNRITDEIFAPARGFPLAHWAEPSSVAVYVDGLPALADQDFGYFLDRDTNTLVFAKPAAPTEGASIEVRYRSVCAP